MLKELLEKMEKARAKLAKVFAEAGDAMDMAKVSELSGTPEEKVAGIRAINDDLAKMGKQVDELRGLESIRENNADAERKAREDRRPPLPGGERKAGDVVRKQNEGRLSFGEAFIAAKGHLPENRHKEIDLPEAVNLKTLFETGAGWAPENLRTGRLVEDAQRPIQVIDIIPGGRTNQAAVVYMEETTFTNNAAEAAEGAQYGEGALVLTERSSSVRKIAVFLPVTDEQLEDVQQVQGYIDNRLRFMLMQRLDSQILNGDGSAPNLQGILTVSGIQTQAKGSEIVPDTIYKALKAVRVTGRAVPSAVILHPNDWEPIRLLRTTDGLYVWGNPSEAGPERIWGLPVVQADSLTENTGLVGDFRQHIELTERRGIQVKVSDSHSDYFIKGKQAIRADVRVALPIYRPEAFCKMTGI